MSDVEVAAAAGTVDVMSEADTAFVIVCIKNAIGGVLTVDANKIASELNYSNPRSVTNKILAIKKKYGLPISTAGSSAAKAAGDTSATSTPKKGAAAPKTPSKATKVTKGKAAAKKTPTKKTSKIPKSAVKAETESESEQVDAEMEDGKETSAEYA